MMQLIWALVIATVALVVVWRCDRYANKRLELIRKRDEAVEADKALSRQERQAAADLAQRTLEETAELERAKKQRQAAEERAAARLAEDPTLIEAKITEEQQVIAARAEGRAIAVKERALRSSESVGGVDMQVLMDGYRDYMNAQIQRAADIETFGVWAAEALPGYDEDED